MIWRKLSASISYFINKELWGEVLLKSNSDLLDDYISLALDFDDGLYYYLDKKTYELLPLSDLDIENIKITFLERIEKKKTKYAAEIESIRIRTLIKESEIEEEKRFKEEKYGKEFKLIQFPKK